MPAPAPPAFARRAPPLVPTGGNALMSPLDPRGRRRRLGRPARTFLLERPEDRAVPMVGYGRTGTGADGNHVDEVQRVQIGKPAAGGTFTLTFDGQTTAPLAQGAGAADVQAALDAIASVEVSDKGLPAGTWDVRFVGA